MSMVMQYKAVYVFEVLKFLIASFNDAVNH
jgi:hypothetical protein